MRWRLFLKAGSGLRAERYALRYLRRQGLRFQACNYACYYGELDLVMQDNDCLVFIEVRFRKNNNYGRAEETVSYHKRQKIMLTAEHYLQSCMSHKLSGCRFDIVAITPDEKGKWHTTWIKNAW